MAHPRRRAAQCPSAANVKGESHDWAFCSRERGTSDDAAAGMLFTLRQFSKRSTASFGQPAAARSTQPDRHVLVSGANRRGGQHAYSPTALSPSSVMCAHHDRFNEVKLGRPAANMHVGCRDLAETETNLQ